MSGNTCSDYTLEEQGLEGQGQSATICKIVARAKGLLPGQLSNKFEMGLAIFAQSLVAVRDAVMHDAGQAVFAAITTIQEIARDAACGGRLVSVAAHRLKAVTVLHDGPPFRAVRAQPSAIFPGLPVYDQVGDFMRNCLRQKILEVFSQELEIDSQQGPAATLDPCLSRTVATQRKVDHGLG